MVALVDTLHEYTKSEAHVEFEPVPLNLVVEDALSNLDQIISKNGARVTHDDLPLVFGHAPLLTQLLQNLIGNGIKYCEADTPAVHVSATPEAEGFWLISVRDNGIGIKQEFHEQIFEPFKRLHDRGKFEGTGLGLATCKKIVNRHNGRIWCESIQDGGTTFKFSLPVPAAGVRAGGSGERLIAQHDFAGTYEMTKAAVRPAPLHSRSNTSPLSHSHRPQRTGVAPILLRRGFGIGDQQRPARRPASIAGRAMQQIDVEQQNVAGLAFHAPCQRIRWRVLCLDAMGARHELRGAVLGPERIEERQGGNRFGELAVGSVAMQLLRAAARPRLTTLDLRQEERLLQDMMNGGQHDRQSANLLHRGIEVEQGMAPIAAAGNRPHLRRQSAGLEGVAKRPDPGLRDSAAQQEITLLVEMPCVPGVEPTDPGARQKLRHGDRPAQEAGLPRYTVSVASVNSRE